MTITTATSADLQQQLTNCDSILAGLRHQLNDIAAAISDAKQKVAELDAIEAEQRQGIGGSSQPHWYPSRI